MKFEPGAIFFVVDRADNDGARGVLDMEGLSEEEAVLPNEDAAVLPNR